MFKACKVRYRVIRHANPYIEIALYFVTLEDSESVSVVDSLLESNSEMFRMFGPSIFVTA